MRIFFLLFLSLFGLQADGIIERIVREEAALLSRSTYGWCSEEKARAFADLVLEVEPEVCVEIGTFGGKSLLPVAAALKALEKGVVIGIDPWDSNFLKSVYDPIASPDDHSYWGSCEFGELYFELFTQLADHQFNEHVILFASTAKRALPQIPRIDILYIDGALTVKASTEDVSLYLPKVRSGGYIWLNNAGHEDRQPAAKILSEACTLIKVIENGNCALFRKK